MRKPIVIMFCVFTLTSASWPHFIIKDLFSKNKRPTVVATVEERDAIKSESVITHFIGLVEQYKGYKAVQYDITTDDGYILGLHRITASPKSSPFKGKPAILMMHGIFESSNDFVVLGPDYLAFLLADAGYDVWLGNVRGNMYSRSHVKYSDGDPEFWNFRLDETGLYDISKMIDFILERTGKTKLTYIGFSMGTTLSYILLSERPKYNNKINLLISLAPVAYVTPPVRVVALVVFTFVSYVAKLLHTSEVLPQLVKTIKFAKTFCNGSKLNPCLLFFSPLKNIEHIDTTKLPLLLSYFPGSTSYYIVEHYRQIIYNGTLRKYDYPCGHFHKSCKNKILYDQKEPPVYDLSTITAPTALFYAKNDGFVRVTDDKKLRDALQNVIHFREVPEETFNHLDYIWSTKAKTLVYDEILELMSKFLSG